MRTAILKEYILKSRLMKMKKIIIANKGKLLKDDSGFSFKLFDGKITNINNQVILI